MNYRLASEKCLPALAAATALAFYFLSGNSIFSPAEPAILLQTVMTISGISSAILTTIKTFVLGNATFKAIRGLKQAGQFANFVSYIKRANELCFLLCGASAIPLFINTSIVPSSLVEISKAFWLMLVAAAAVSTWQVLRYFGAILTIQSRAEESPSLN